jgi:hypothetical protein
METRRGKYWESDPIRQKKAEEKRERRNSIRQERADYTRFGLTKVV